jgi:hypothetical protein
MEPLPGDKAVINQTMDEVRTRLIAVRDQILVLAGAAARGDDGVGLEPDDVGGSELHVRAARSPRSNCRGTGAARR